jgi:hypothetical protein
MIVEVWSLKRGIIDPPEHSAWVEDLWWRQNNPEESE